MDAADMQEFSARAAAVGLELWPALVEIAGVSYPATVTEPKIGMGLITGADQVEGSLVARVKIADLAEAPALQQMLRWKRPADAGWRPVKWWIDEVKRSPLDVEWMVGCVPKN